MIEVIIIILELSGSSSLSIIKSSKPYNANNIREK